MIGQTFMIFKLHQKMDRLQESDDFEFNTQSLFSNKDEAGSGNEDWNPYNELLHIDR
jgi:hypothetical protein